MTHIDIAALVHTLTVGAVAYASLLLLLRLSGKRTLSKWNAFDLIVTIAFGSTLATSLLSEEVSAVQSAVAFALLILLQLLVTWSSVRSRRLERLIKSEPALLVYSGILQAEALQRERVTESEVKAALRAKGILELAEVQALVLETNGDFSVISRMVELDGYALSDVKRPRDHRL